MNARHDDAFAMRVIAQLDPDTVVDLLGLSTEELVAAFAHKFDDAHVRARIEDLLE